MMAKHVKTENLYLINAGLDVVYIGTGFLLKHFSINNLNKQNLLKGHGNSVILQGGFLMISI
jgi:collagenase-like PrtC family protease